MKTKLFLLFWSFVKSEIGNLSLLSFEFFLLPSSPPPTPPPKLEVSAL